MKPSFTTPLLALLGLFLVLVLLRRDEAGDPAPQLAGPSEIEPPGPPAELPPTPGGDVFLHGFGDHSTTPVEDLQKIGRTVEGMLVLFKNLDTRHIATNAQLASYLRGNNPEQLVFVSPNHPVFNSDGLLVDRWDSPLFIHPIGTGLIELRSAGPDRILHNEDDLNRRPDGSFGTHPPGGIPRSR